MSLDNQQKRALIAKAHHLKPVVRIGQKGLTENLIQETDQSLKAHELLKIHIAEDDRELRRELAWRLARETDAEVVHQIGKTFTLYRKKEDKE